MALDSVELNEIKAFAIELARNTGNILLEYFQQPLKVDYKGKNRGDDPVTEADRKAEDYIQEQLSKQFPTHSIVGEEGAGTGRAPTEFTWVVDPLDGTTNFYNNLPSFACSIALLHEGTPIVSAIFIPWPGPTVGRIFHASLNGGAWESEIPLSVAPGDRPIAGRIVVLPRFTGNKFSVGDSLKKTPGERRSVGSIVYELALIANGTYQYGLFGTPKSWDVAAGILLVKEAGGLVLSRNTGKEGWYNFSAFQSLPNEQIPGQKSLRDWTAPIIAGNPSMAKFVGEQIQENTFGFDYMKYKFGKFVPKVFYRLNKPSDQGANTKR
ncbi:hypothetical protein FIM02_01020 [SAR202 cluster bacterium AD-802-E10_MRT_200m]|nr:hypothetical protein [SAR202 cluster bacterium AD-802-E10_MRT_200m]